VKSRAKVNIKKALKFSEQLAVEAGDLLLSYQKKLNKLEIHHKEAEGVASTADLEAEKYICSRLEKEFPGTLILSEEDAFLKKLDSYQQYLNAEYCWVIDPLDGTNNFLNGIDYFAVCIGLLKKGKPYMGVVYRPRTGECFSAVHGEGAYKKDFFTHSRKKKIFAEKNEKKLAESLCCTGFSQDKGDIVDDEIRIFRHISRNSRTIRRFGSAALDMCYVAEGLYDGFWEKRLSAWDVVASGVICLEAGVKVTNFSGRTFNPFKNDFLAARTPLHNRLKKLIAETYQNLPLD